MERFVKILWCLSLAYAVVLTGPLLMFNPWFVRYEQQRHHVAERLNASQWEVDYLTGEILSDIHHMGDFSFSFQGYEPFLTDAERSHMIDVMNVFQTLAVFELAALFFVIAGFFLFRSIAIDIGYLMLVTAKSIVISMSLLGLAIIVAFQQIFELFHQLLFAAGTYSFALDSTLIMLFPLAFWSEISLIAGSSVLLTAIGVGMYGWSLKQQPNMSVALAG